MQTTPRLGPNELGSLLALDGKGVGFGRSKENRLSITTDEKGSVSRVDPVF